MFSDKHVPESSDSFLALCCSGFDVPLYPVTGVPGVSFIPCLRIIHTGSRPRRVDIPAERAMIAVPHGYDPVSADPLLPVSRPGTVSLPGRTGPNPPDEPASAPVYGVRP